MDKIKTTTAYVEFLFASLSCKKEQEVGGKMKGRPFSFWSPSANIAAKIQIDCNLIIKVSRGHGGPLLP